MSIKINMVVHVKTFSFIKNKNKKRKNRLKNIKYTMEVIIPIYINVSLTYKYHDYTPDKSKCSSCDYISTQE